MKRFLFLSSNVFSGVLGLCAGYLVFANSDLPLSERLGANIDDLNRLLNRGRDEAYKVVGEGGDPGKAFGSVWEKIRGRIEGLSGDLEEGESRDSILDKIRKLTGELGLLSEYASGEDAEKMKETIAGLESLRVSLGDTGSGTTARVGAMSSSFTEGAAAASAVIPGASADADADPGAILRGLLDGLPGGRSR